MRRITTCGWIVLAAMFPSAARAGAQEFHVSLVPDTLVVDVDSVFTVQFFAESTAVQFNAYDVTIEYDPSLLEFVSVARGSLMIAACGNAIDFLETTSTSVTYSHILLGQGCIASGPGVLSEFTFRALDSGTALLDLTADPDTCIDGHTRFYDEGYCVPFHPELPRAVFAHDAVVVIGDDMTGVEDVIPAVGALQFRPNPARQAGEFSFSLPGSGPARLDVFDPAGRRVFSRTWESVGRGVRVVPWGGTDPRGAALAAGVYFARLEQGTHRETAKIVLLR